MSKKTKPPATAAYIAAAEYADDATLAPAILAAAEDLRDRARDVWLSSDEERDWRVGGDAWGGTGPDTLFSVCPSDIEERISDDCRDYGEWGDQTETLFINDWASPIDPVTDEPIEGERVDVTTTIEVDEPDCTGDGHDWQSPEMLGGLAENPGVVGHGGGVIVTEVCAHCGKYKSTDTWAQNRSTGEQGLTSIEYADADEKSERWLATLRDIAMIDACPYILQKDAAGKYSVFVCVINEADDIPIEEIRAAIGKKWDVEWNGECETNTLGNLIRKVEIEWSGS